MEVHNNGASIKKMEKVNARASKYVYNVKHASYQQLLDRIRLPSMESRRIEDKLLTIHNIVSNEAPRAIRNLINLRSFKYNLKNMFYLYLKLTLPNMGSSHGDVLQPRNEMNYQMTLE